MKMKKSMIRHIKNSTQQVKMKSSLSRKVKYINIYIMFFKNIIK
jgi:hypothetical protein